MAAMRLWRQVARLTACLATVVPLAVPLAVVGGPGLPSAHAQPPQWGSCAPWLDDTSRIPTAQCAAVAVPTDWTEPTDSPAAQQQLAVIRVPATGDRIGALMVNPGGPGASAVDTVADMAAALAGSPLTDRFDLVGFDQRGVGHSTPQLRCRTDAEFDAYRREPMVDFSPAGVARIEDAHRQFAQLCLDRMGAQFLVNAGTVAGAHDMDAVRAALGEDQINYLGFSYGTLLGAAYAQLYPDRVRAMVLDGAVDPSQDPVAKIVRQNAGFQQAFDEYAADCAKTEGCPLGADPTQFVNRFHQLVDPLVARPGYTSDPRGLSYSDAITGTGSALYSRRYWPYLTSGLLGLERGTDAGDLLALADQYLHRDAQGHYSNQQDAFTVIRCVDSAFPTDPAVWVEADRALREAAPFMSYGQFTGYAPRDTCALWPVPATPVPHPVTSPGPGKVVVVATSDDPATPYQSGVDLARQLQAPLITFEGSQHTVVFNGDACVDTTVLAYLTELLTPPADVRCS